ncbi:MAG TPA: hypothetical protein G4N96_06415 [Chloroflexi bacterium]|nr:hypothetical protein [Chloroflexota bacterium]
MVTRELVKTEVDKVHDDYLDVLFKIVKALENSPVEGKNISTTKIALTELDKRMAETHSHLPNHPLTEY